MKITFFSTKSYDKQFMSKANQKYGFELHYFDAPLSKETAILAKGSKAICIFVNDKATNETLQELANEGVELIALRCAGSNNVDLDAAEKLNIKVVRVPAYSPYAVAEHTLAMILTLTRKTHLAYNRIRDGNFSLEKLLGFDLHGKTVGVIGTGKIGNIFCQIMLVLGCKVLAYDPYPESSLEEKNVEYVDLDQLLSNSDIISLHCPLTKESYHLINKDSIKKMKDNIMLINTSRGGLLDAKALVQSLKSGKIGYLGLDVYEQEENLFFQDLSGSVIQDDVITRLITFPNVLITAHQAFFTENAMSNIAETTLQNIKAYQEKRELTNEVKAS